MIQIHSILAGNLEVLAGRLRQAIFDETPTGWTVTQVASAPRRRNPNLLVHTGDLYLFGGYSVHERYIEDRNVLLKYDASTGRFEGVGVVKVEGHEGFFECPSAGRNIVAGALES